MLMQIHIISLLITNADTPSAFFNILLNVIRIWTDKAVVGKKFLFFSLLLFCRCWVVCINCLFCCFLTTSTCQLLFTCSFLFSYWRVDFEHHANIRFLNILLTENKFALHYIFWDLWFGKQFFVCPTYIYVSF